MSLSFNSDNLDGGVDLRRRKLCEVAHTVSNFCGRTCFMDPKPCSTKPSDTGELDVFTQHVVSCLNRVCSFEGEDMSKENLLISVAHRILAAIHNIDDLADDPSVIRFKYRDVITAICSYVELLSSLSFLFHLDDLAKRGSVALTLHEINNKLTVSPSTKAEAYVFNRVIRVLVANMIIVLEGDGVLSGFSTSDPFSRSQVEIGSSDTHSVQYSYTESTISSVVPSTVLRSVISNFSRGAFQNHASRVDVVFVDGAMVLCCDAPCPFADTSEFQSMMDKGDKGVVSGGQGYLYSNMAVRGALKREPAAPHALSLCFPVSSNVMDLVRTDNYTPTFAIKVDLA